MVNKFYVIMNKQIVFVILIVAGFFTTAFAQESKEIRLIVRGDDIGLNHASNKGCITSYKDGIMRTVEVMPTCSWFPEAVKLLNENPGLEVGVHLVLTSEWEGYKCRPLTNAPSLVDENGYFYPMVHPNKYYTDSEAFVNIDWDSTEVDNELRAQIDLALKNIPHINHLSPHMATMLCSPKLIKVFEKVAADYNLRYEYSLGITRLKGVGGKNKTFKERETTLINTLEELQPGTWMLLLHPAYNTPEMQAITLKGYKNTAIDRENEMKVLTSDKVAKVIKRRGIKLITYQDLLDEGR